MAESPVQTDGTINAVQFGMLIQRMDDMINRFDKLETNIENNYARKDDVDALKIRVSTLEQAPRQRRAEIIAGLACLFTLFGGGGTLIGLFLHK